MQVFFVLIVSFPLVNFNHFLCCGKLFASTRFDAVILLPLLTYFPKHHILDSVPYNLAPSKILSTLSTVRIYLRLPSSRHPILELRHSLTSLYSRIGICITMAPKKVTDTQVSPKKGSGTSPSKSVVNEQNLLFLWHCAHNNKGNTVSFEILLILSSLLTS